jgi:hypothetical protein
MGKKYDLAIMLCEGGFPLMDTDEENFAILQNVVETLKPGGKFIFTTLSVLYPIFEALKKNHDKNTPNGFFEKHSFDLMTFRDRNLMSIPDDDGKIRNLDCNERYYAPSEITWLLKTLGMQNIEIWGCENRKFQKKTGV